MVFCQMHPVTNKLLMLPDLPLQTHKSLKAVSAYEIRGHGGICCCAAQLANMPASSNSHSQLQANDNMSCVLTVGTLL